MVPLLARRPSAKNRANFAGNFNPSPEFLSYVSGKVTASLSLPRSLLLSSPLSLYHHLSLLPGKINRSALKFSVLSVKMAKRLHKAPTKLWSVNEAAQSQLQPQQQHLSLWQWDERSQRCHGHPRISQCHLDCVAAASRTHNGSWQARTSYSGSERGEYLMQKIWRGDWGEAELKGGSRCKESRMSWGWVAGG